MAHFNNSNSNELMNLFGALDWNYSNEFQGTSYHFHKSDRDKAKHAQAMLNLYSIPNTYADAVNYIFLTVLNEDDEPQYSMLMSLISKD